MGYDKCDVFVFLISATIASFFDIVFPNRLCNLFVKNNIKKMFVITDQYEQSDSNSICAEFQPEELDSCDVAEGDSSESGSNGYDEAELSTGSEQKSHED